MSSGLQRAFVLGLMTATASAAVPNDGVFDLGWGDSGSAHVAFDLGGKDWDSPTDAVVGPDDAMYIVGSVQDGNGDWHIGLAKLTPTGNIDTSFGTDGKVVSPPDYHATGLALRNNTLYVGGYKTFSGDSRDFAVCVFNTSGAPLHFLGTGTSCVTASIDAGPLSQDVANDIAVQSDGKIVLGGYTAPTSPYEHYSAFARFNADGTLDDTFGFFNSGLQLIRNANYASEEINAIGIASNGKIVGVGAGTANNGETGARGLLVRLGVTGQQDNIGPSGEYSYELDGSGSLSTVFNDLALVDTSGADDAIVAVGSAEVTPDRSSAVIAKLTPTGPLDPSFSGGDGTNGYSLILSASASIRFNAVARQLGSGFVVAASLFDGYEGDVAIMRYGENGVSDTTLTTVIDDGHENARDVVVGRNAIYVTIDRGYDYYASKLVLDRVFANGFSS